MLRYNLHENLSHVIRLPDVRYRVNYVVVLRIEAGRSPILQHRCSLDAIEHLFFIINISRGGMRAKMQFVANKKAPGYRELRRLSCIFHY
jgi:hypothetical protein